ncbi:MAG: hypothetical protein JW749_12310 [Sedimentisphaerales bacterium]|nr:hypothetical protein [Sedimentisphaerales bacterium]
MTEKDNILRAWDVIPNRPSEPAVGEDESLSDIPQFNLADDIMAEQRRLTAARRQRPSTEDRGQRTEEKQPSFAQSFTSQWDPVIADIVARDIERLCKGDF